MYSVVGSDGQVYGPVDMATIGQWIQEGRILPSTSLIDPIDGRVIQAQQAPALYGLFPNPTAAPPVPGGTPMGGAGPMAGYPRPDATPAYYTPAKSKVAAILLAFFLGGLGIHRFYLGHNGTGAAILGLFFAGFFTCGATWIASGIWALVDLILIATGSLREANGRELV